MTMLTLGVDGSRDLFLDRQGSIVVRQDQDAMVDFLQQRLSTLTGECIFNKSYGIPYMTTTFQSGLSGVAPLSAAMQAALSNGNTRGVASVAGVKMSAPTEGELAFVVGAVTEFGLITVGNGQ